jgi:catechol 2,3-dioxygenase-like lactoylglutathione lyase family enzyme
MNLNQVTIYSDKVTETVEFFQKLGLELIVDSLPRYARLLCPDGDSTLSIDFAENIPQTSAITLYFECENLDEKVAELKANGMHFIEETTDRPWLWRQSYLLDPNNNKICLFYAGVNRKNPPWRVK